MSKQKSNLKSRAGFIAEAKGLTLKIGDQALAANPREFSTGSVGWLGTGKVMVEHNGELVQCQVSCNITVVGSKDLPK